MKKKIKTCINGIIALMDIEKNKMSTKQARSLYGNQTNNLHAFPNIQEFKVRA